MRRAEKFFYAFAVVLTLLSYLATNKDKAYIKGIEENKGVAYQSLLDNAVLNPHTSGYVDAIVLNEGTLKFKKGVTLIRFLTEHNSLLSKLSSLSGQLPDDPSVSDIVRSVANTVTYVQPKLDGTDPEHLFTAYGAINEKESGCQGMASLTCLLYRYYGYDCNLTYSLDDEHMWNVLLLDGELYDIDTTRAIDFPYYGLPRKYRDSLISEIKNINSAVKLLNNSSKDVIEFRAHDRNNASETVLILRIIYPEYQIINEEEYIQVIRRTQ